MTQRYLKAGTVSNERGPGSSLPRPLELLGAAQPYLPQLQRFWMYSQYRSTSACTSTSRASFPGLKR